MGAAAQGVFEPGPEAPGVVSVFQWADWGFRGLVRVLEISGQ